MPSKTDQLFQLHTPFQPAGDQPAAIRALTEGLESGLAEQTLLGVTGSGKTFTLANVIANVQRPTLIMAPNKTLAAQLYSEMREFFPKNAVEYFVSYYDYYQPEAYVPASDTYIAKDAAVNDHIEQMRLSATKALLEREDTIIVASVSAIYGLGDPKMYLQMLLHMVRGEPYDQRQLLRRLAELQYSRNDVNFERGTYRVRGESIDIFPAESDRSAIRVTFFDDLIETITSFDPLTGTVEQQLPRYTIYPKTHYATQRQTILDSIDVIKVELSERLIELQNDHRLVEAQRLRERIQFDIEMMYELGYCNGIENYSRYLSGRGPGEAPPTLFDYLPKNSLLVLDESHVTVPQIGGMYKGDRSRKETLVTYGFRLPSALDNRPMRFDEFKAISPQTIYVSATPSAYELENSGAIVEQVVRPTGLLDPEIMVRPVAGQVDDILGEIRIRMTRHERVLITTLTKRMSEDLTEYLAEHQIKVRYLHSDIDTVERMEIIRDLRLGVFDVLVGINLLREGLDIPEVSLVGILDADKEGFLRSARSLIQTIGRAARNSEGKVILYADRITDSMKIAISETERRRETQHAHNIKHGITPRTILKTIREGIDVGKPASSETHTDSTSFYTQTAETYLQFDINSTADLERKIVELEKKMRLHAKQLEFEQAAKLRDVVNKLRKQALV